MPRAPRPEYFVLQIGQHGGKIVIGELLPMVEKGVLAGREPPIVDEAATSERLRKHALLFVSQVEPVLVCPQRFPHSLCAFLLLL
jgi:hypothetical protein